MYSELHKQFMLLFIIIVSITVIIITCIIITVTFAGLILEIHMIQHGEKKVMTAVLMRTMFPLSVLGLSARIIFFGLIKVDILC